MNFSLVPPLPPPEFSDQRLYFITKCNGDFEAAHSEGWDCLYDSLEKNFMPRLRYQLFLPTLELCQDPLFDEQQACLFVFAYKGRKAEIFLVMFGLLDPQELFDQIEHKGGSGFAEKKTRFVPIKLLTRGFLIDIQQVLDFLAFSKVSTAENQAVVRKKQVG